MIPQGGTKFESHGLVRFGSGGSAGKKKAS
jgi:hypothetical protein